MEVRKVSLAMFVFGLFLFLSAASASAGYTYYNHASVKVEGNDVIGWTMAWVKSEWTFATKPDGTFLLDNYDTFHETDHGGHWPDDGSWGYTSTNPSPTALSFYGQFTLHSPFNSISGIVYNKVVYHTWDHTYAWYRGVKGKSLEWDSLPLPPIDVSVDV